jgi:hypothetical protein
MLQLEAPHSVPKTISTDQNASSVVMMATPWQALPTDFARKIRLRLWVSGQEMRQNVNVRKITVLEFMSDPIFHECYFTIMLCVRVAKKKERKKTNRNKQTKHSIIRSVFRFTLLHVFTAFAVNPDISNRPFPRKLVFAYVYYWDLVEKTVLYYFCEITMIPNAKRRRHWLQRRRKHSEKWLAFCTFSSNLHLSGSYFLNIFERENSNCTHKRFIDV